MSLNTQEEINIGLSRSRDLFKATRDPVWLRLAGLYLTAKDASFAQRQNLLNRLEAATKAIIAGEQPQL